MQPETWLNALPVHLWLQDAFSWTVGLSGDKDADHENSAIACKQELVCHKGSAKRAAVSKLQFCLGLGRDCARVVKQKASCSCCVAGTFLWRRCDRIGFLLATGASLLGHNLAVRHCEDSADIGYHVIFHCIIF